MIGSQFRGLGAIVDAAGITNPRRASFPVHWRQIMAETARDGDQQAMQDGAAAAGAEIPSGLAGLSAAAAQLGPQKRGLPPVHLWNPPYCGDIGLKITRDGAWHYRGSPINRPALVRLFSTILRRDPDRHVLVTPVEMVLVEVEDAPFLAVELSVEDGARGRRLSFRTNVDDHATAGPEHPLTFESGPAEGLKPYIDVRAGLRALVARPLLYQLVELGETRDINGVPMYGVASDGEFFVMAPAADIEGLA
jgi:hypothetical protein